MGTLHVLVTDGEAEKRLQPCHNGEEHCTLESLLCYSIMHFIYKN